MHSLPPTRVNEKAAALHSRSSCHLTPLATTLDLEHFKDQIRFDLVLGKLDVVYI